MFHDSTFISYIGWFVLHVKVRTILKLYALSHYLADLKKYHEVSPNKGKCFFLGVTCHVQKDRLKSFVGIHSPENQHDCFEKPQFDVSPIENGDLPFSYSFREGYPSLVWFSHNHLGLPRLRFSSFKSWRTMECIQLMLGGR